MKLLDVYCGAGGAAAGYARAGFEVTGVDHVPQPRYPFTFIEADAIAVLSTVNLADFDAIHASPPCQRFSTMTQRWGRSEEHPDLIEMTRQLLTISGRPYIIENVPGAPLHNPVTLCGSHFGLKVRRHRLFETSFEVDQPLCDHRAQGKVVGVYGHAGGSSKRDGLTFAGTDSWRAAMDIDWMVGAELAEAIPPAYTEYLGRQLLAFLQRRSGHHLARRRQTPDPGRGAGGQRPALQPRLPLREL